MGQDECALRKVESARVRADAVDVSDDAIASGEHGAALGVGENRAEGIGSHGFTQRVFGEVTKASHKARREATHGAKTQGLLIGARTEAVVKGTERSAVVHEENRAEGGAGRGSCAWAENVSAAPSVDVVDEVIEENQGRQVCREWGFVGAERVTCIKQSRVRVGVCNGFETPGHPVDHCSGDFFMAQELGECASRELCVARTIRGTLQELTREPPPAGGRHAVEVHQP